MLYRLNLLDKKSYEMLFEREIIAIGYKQNKTSENIPLNEGVENFNEGLNNFIDRILNINSSDLIWINYKGKFSLGKVLGRTYFDKDRFLGLIKVEVYRYYGVLPFKIVDGCEDILIEKFSDSEIEEKSVKIFNALKNLNEEMFDVSSEDSESDKVIELEFEKNENELVEVKNTYGIVPYRKSKKVKRKDLELNNFGELVIELHPPDQKKLETRKLPAVLKSYPPAMKSGMDFYLDMIKKRVKNFSEREKNSYSLCNVDNYIWGSFLKKINSNED